MKTNPNDSINSHEINSLVAKLKNSPICLGLTKREYFASIAMQGILASSFMDCASGARKENEKELFPTLAMGAVIAADALITELNKEPT